MSLIPIVLDQSVINTYLSSEDWHPLGQYLKDKFVISRHEVTGEPIPLVLDTNTVQILVDILQNTAAKCVTVGLIYLLKEVFRSLRNCVAFSSKNQDLLTTNTDVAPIIREFIYQLLDSKLDGHVECVNAALQFLTNIITNNSDNAILVWEVFKRIILKLVIEPKYSYCAAALLYNIMLLQRSVLDDCNEVYNYLLQRVSTGSENEYHTFLLELFLQNESFMKLYTTFEEADRIIILSALEHFLNKDNTFISHSVLHILVTVFKSNSDCILKTVSSYVESVQPQEVVLLLELLAKSSSGEKYRQQLQDDTDLLIKCCFLLRNIHSLGKESQNVFTPIQKLSEVPSCNTETRTNPIFGFKSDLIRFLGNMAWKNKDNQDKMRELECIPLLLDCCNMDARNPFIIQWSVLAIRNLCENNASNQAIIAGLTKRGVVDSSTLQEMGLTLHDDGEKKIIVGPLPQHNT